MRKVMGTTTTQFPDQLVPKRILRRASIRITIPWRGEKRNASKNKRPETAVIEPAIELSIQEASR